MKTHPLAIGLTGPAGSGKDTIAALLLKHCGIVPIAFADPLRTEIMDAFGVPIQLLTDRATKEVPTRDLAMARCLNGEFVEHIRTRVGPHFPFMHVPRSPRQIMQWWGTEYRRSADPHYWTTAMALRLHTLMDEGNAVAVTDVRFLNEVHLVRNFYGEIWQVARPGLSIAPTAHASEVTGEEFAPDLVIDNSGDLLHLQRQVLAAAAGSVPPGWTGMRDWEHSVLAAATGSVAP